jgi:hypothetical protein
MENSGSEKCFRFVGQAALWYVIELLINPEYAAAFFLLADKLSDAVNVCLKNMEDIQLAILIIRVYEGTNQQHNFR